MTTFRRLQLRSLLLGGVVAAILLPVDAFTQAPFYQGKTVTVVISTSPGGTGDLRVKALLPFLRKHIPGNPTVLSEYMEGGGGRKAGNYMFRTARADGLTIGAMGSGVVALQLMRESGVMYEIDKFIYLGAPESVGHQIIYTRKELGLNNLEKLRAKSGIADRRTISGTRLVYLRTILCLLDRSQGSQVYRWLHRSRSRRAPCSAASSMRGRI